MNFCLYLQFPFSLRDKELLYYSSPYVGIATLGCLPRRKAYFDSWHSPHTTNNLEATELYTPLEPKRRPKTDLCVHTEQTTAPFIPTSFQGLPAWHLPSCVSVPWVSQQPGRGSAASFQRCGIQLWGTGGAPEEFQRLVTPRAPPVSAQTLRGCASLLQSVTFSF